MNPAHHSKPSCQDPDQTALLTLQHTPLFPGMGPPELMVGNTVTIPVLPLSRDQPWVLRYGEATPSCQPTHTELGTSSLQLREKWKQRRTKLEKLC